MSYVSDFASLFFPSYCAACGQVLVKSEETLCLKCQISLPRTYMHDERGNRIERLFWGRVDLASATAFLKMPKSGLVSRLIYELKYHENKNVGIKLGKLFGHELKNSSSMHHFDAIIPVPLHPKKFHIRGYNQCDCIADGIQQTLETDVMTENLVRVKYTESQTKRARYERWENVDAIFEVRDPKALEGKNILLVDDVITTGSTIEACASVLNVITGLQLSVAALAVPVLR